MMKVSDRKIFVLKPNIVLHTCRNASKNGLLTLREMHDIGDGSVLREAVRLLNSPVDHGQKMNFSFGVNMRLSEINVLSLDLQKRSTLEIN